MPEDGVWQGRPLHLTTVPEVQNEHLGDVSEAIDVSLK